MKVVIKLLLTLLFAGSMSVLSAQEKQESFNADSLYAKARDYQKGENGVLMDKGKARELLILLADYGDVRAQNDLYMSVSDAANNSAQDNLAQSLSEGTLTRGQLQRSARNILRVLLRTPAMMRLLDRLSQEEKEAEAQLSEDDRVDFDLPFLPIEEKLTLDISTVSTDRGASCVYGLAIHTPGFYSLQMRLRVDAEALAQVPVTVFANGNNMGTFTFTGENRDTRELTVDLGLMIRTNNFVKLYFAQSGIRLEELTISLKEKLTRRFWE